MTGEHAKSWNDFWAQSKSSGQGCLPAAGYEQIDAAQKARWVDLAKQLPRNARVLDLATGNGLVMRWMLGERRDLKLTGVDLAPVLPPSPKGTKTRAGVPMEELPFPDDRFHAVVSQFGFEYGDTAKVAEEAARVLGKGGTLAILTHRQDGPILAHNLKRREQIRWAIDEKNLPDIARKSLQLRGRGIFTIPTAIQQAPEEGARLHGPQSAAWEIAEALRQTLAMSRHDHPANVARLIDTMVFHARNELGRIASLEAACATTADEERFTAAIEAAGFEPTGIEPVLEKGRATRFADFRTYRLS
ncbi:Methyltransferase domain-containing protein [Altererythrobacter xiamenensis]|uniref:Methyltransferase domain-containing protein n=1 Tax=Altererythrobacter xiamenensis TaxID=1316679 RepID=A0A1Y6EHR9_9SPHN|nr:class I SAM-dependent methyltransferase [Altererythrobacter xiamenensis]SMQ62164.1 Methyltransferase domain-containing protein [Altererythrobacter xiamenensis]